MNTVLRTATQTMLASDNSAPSEYLIVVPVRFHRVSASSVAGESAFCEHLRMLLRLLGDTFDSLTVASPAMDPAEYERNRGHLGVIDEASERIRWVALHPANAGTPAFWLQHFVPGVRKLWREVRRAELLHTGTSHNLMRPVEFTALLMAALLGKKSM